MGQRLAGVAVCFRKFAEVHKMGVGVLFEHHYFRCFVKLVSFRVSPRCHPLFVSLALVHQPFESQIVIRDLPSPLHYFQVKTYESKLAEYGIPPEERSGQTRLPDVKVRKS